MEPIHAKFDGDTSDSRWDRRGGGSNLTEIVTALEKALHVKQRLLKKGLKIVKGHVFNYLN